MGTSMRPSQRGRRLRQAMAAVTLAGMWALASAGQAGAHAALVSTDPADGAHLTVAPTAVTLTFNEDMSPLGAEIEIACEQGGDHAVGETVVEGTTITRQFDYADMPGGFTVTWRAVSADGHPVSGTFGFSVVPDAAASTAGTPTPAGSPTVAPSTAPSPTQVVTGAPQPSWIQAWGGWVTAGVILLAALAALAAMRRHYRKQT